MNIIYCRRSVADDNSLSLEIQEKQCRERIGSSKEPVQVIIDNGISGSTTLKQREGGRKLLELINNGSVSKIYVAKQDRLFRNTHEYLELLNLLELKNVGLVMLDNDVNLQSSNGKFITTITASLAEMERNLIRDRAYTSSLARIQLGVHTGGQPTLGYKLADTVIDGRRFHILEPNEEEIPVILEIFNLYVNSNYSIYGITKELKLKYYHLDINEFKINRILRNPIYVKCDMDIYNYYLSQGITVYNKANEFDGIFSGRLVGRHVKGRDIPKSNRQYTFYLTKTQGIISSSTFIQAQDKLSRNKVAKRLGTGQRHNTWINSLLYCSSCGHVIEIYSNQVEKLYGRCRYKWIQGCPGVGATIRIKEVQDAIIPIIKQKILELKHVELCENKNDVEINNLKLQISTINKEIQDYISKIPQANEAVMNIINEKIESLTQEKHSLELEISKLLASSKVNTCKPSDEVIEKVQGFEKLSIQDQRFVARTLIDKIVLGSENDGELVASIHFKF